MQAGLNSHKKQTVDPDASNSDYLVDSAVTVYLIQ